MSFLKLGPKVRGQIRALLFTLAVVSPAMAPALARADGAAPPRLALASEPNAARPAMVDAPSTTRMSDAPAPSESPSGRSSWWVWALIAAGVAGVAALVLTSSSGKDPACPSDRVCH